MVQTTTIALQNTWQSFLVFVPNLIGALVVFIIGWFIAALIGRLVANILTRFKINQLFEETGWQETLEKAEIKTRPTDFIGAIFKWILVIVFLQVAAEILGFFQFANVLDKMIGWLPNLIVAAAIFIVAVILADILGKIIRAGAEKIGIKFVGVLDTIVRGAIYIFAGLAILLQLGVAESLINSIITAFLGTIALSLGLAFGLGGKDAAAELIKDLKKKLSK